LDTYQTYKAVFDASPDAVIIADEEGLIQLANRQAENLFGYVKEELMGEQVELLIPEGYRKGHKDHRNRYAAQPAVREMGAGLELFARRKNGSRFPVEISLSPIDLPGKKLVAAAIRDITERKLMEQKLVESENRFRSVLNNMLEGVTIIGFDWRYLYVNETIAGHGRLTKEQMVGYTLMEVYRGVEHTELFKVLEQCMKERVVKHVEVPYHFSDNTSTWFEMSVQPIPEGIFVLTIDITERKKAETLLAQSEQRYRHVVENVSDAIMIDDVEGRVVFANKRFLQLYGYSETGLPHLKLEDYLAPEYRALLRDWHNRRVAGEDVPDLFEYEGLHKNGSRIWVEVQVSKVMENGVIKGTQSAIRDITERKKTELKLSETMQATQRTNKELEQFTYMVSHDLQEPLRMVSGFLNLLQSETGEQLNAEAKEYIHYAVDGADRMKVLIEDLLQYSRVGTNKEDFTLVDLKELVQYVLLVMQETIDSTDATIRVQALPVVKANKTLVTQLFQNLIGNALKYRSAAKPQIEIGVKQENEEPVFYVRDNGIGIEQRHFEKVFVIFKRVHTRGQYSGTGIGLAICKKIVEKHGGRIWVESEPGKGSTFYFTLGS